MRARADAHRPRRADVVVDGAQHEIAVEHLDAAVLPIGDVDVALGVGRDRVRDVELIRLGAAGPHRLDEAPVLVVLRDARVDVAVGHVDVALRIPRDVGGTVEAVRLGRRRLRLHRRRLDARHRLGPAAHGHHHPAFRAELDDHVRAFVHRPDVVLRVHAHGVRHLEAVEALADLADEGALLIELEQPRVAAAREDEDVALRVARHADALAEVEVRRQLQEVRHRLERDVGRRGVGGGARRHRLGRRRRGEHNGRSRQQKLHKPLHSCLRARLHHSRIQVGPSTAQGKPFDGLRTGGFEPIIRGRRTHVLGSRYRSRCCPPSFIGGGRDRSPTPQPRPSSRNGICRSRSASHSSPSYAVSRSSSGRDGRRSGFSRCSSSRSPPARIGRGGRCSARRGHSGAISRGGPASMSACSDCGGLSRSLRR